jgi:hypothetical protein
MDVINVMLKTGYIIVKDFSEAHKQVGLTIKKIFSSPGTVSSRMWIRFNRTHTEIGMCLTNVLRCMFVMYVNSRILLRSLNPTSLLFVLFNLFTISLFVLISHREISTKCQKILCGPKSKLIYSSKIKYKLSIISSLTNYLIIKFMKFRCCEILCVWIT